MNRTAFTEAYFQERKESRTIASTAVMQHSFKRALQRKLILGILISTVLLMIFGTLLLVLPALKVETIQVEGIETIDKESVIAASGISIGDEILELNKNEIVDRIAQTKGIESVSVSTSFRGVSIQIVEE